MIMKVRATKGDRNVVARTCFMALYVNSTDRQDKT